MHMNINLVNRQLKRFSPPVSMDAKKTNLANTKEELAKAQASLQKDGPGCCTKDKIQHLTNIAKQLEAELGGTTHANPPSAIPPK